MPKKIYSRVVPARLYAANRREQVLLAAALVVLTSLAAVTITATGADNVSTTVASSVTLDQKPTISITAPLSGVAVTPAARVTASCTDDDRCVRLRLLDAARQTAR